MAKLYDDMKDDRTLVNKLAELTQHIRFMFMKPEAFEQNVNSEFGSIRAVAQQMKAAKSYFQKIRKLTRSSSQPNSSTLLKKIMSPGKLHCKTRIPNTLGRACLRACVKNY